MQSSTKLAVALALIATTTSAAVEYSFTPRATPQDARGVSHSVVQMSLVPQAQEVGEPAADLMSMRWAHLTSDGQ